MDNPKVAAGNNEVSVTAWEAPDVDGGEAQADRVRREDAAIDVCVGCPVMVECLAYGASLNRAGKLAVPHGILGGMTALERHRAFVKTRHEVTAPAPDHRLRTEQKMAVLRALAVHSDPYEVASAARMDVRTAGWQRSAIVTLMGLPRSASRMELLTAAVERGLVDAGLVVADDGTVLACPSGVKTHTVEPNGQMLLWAVEFERLLARLPVAEEPAPAVRRVERRPSLRARFVDVPGQLDLLLAAMEADLADVVDVCSLFPATPLEAAA
ncbi:WhiB family transcriptional regulator [Streptomyces sp. NPDC007074]|uniref:WhiB family transcriptional regulator n=1 Tax=Streptomyces sp. NPDC007074 TaxID=3156764 RepID=UPI0033EBBE5F